MATNSTVDHELAGGARRSVVLDAIIALVALVGLADAVYLTVEHVTGQSVRCTVVTGCSEVLSSSYATIGRFPLAALGAIAYFTVFSLATLSTFGYTSARKLLALLVALMCATTLWLLYVQAFIIQHFCQYCLLSAAVTLTLTILVVINQVRQRHARIK
ncbi:MAG: hypothetical protein DMF64_09885 [Acidobacteria bacterium]|nr:MAG: hypothetical protein DMF64_09885 [Acidobacteriota bacterium]